MTSPCPKKCLHHRCGNGLLRLGSFCLRMGDVARKIWIFAGQMKETCAGNQSELEKFGFCPEKDEMPSEINPKSNLLMILSIVTYGLILEKWIGSRGIWQETHSWKKYRGESRLKLFPSTNSGTVGEVRHTRLQQSGYLSELIEPKSILKLMIKLRWPAPFFFLPDAVVCGLYKAHPS